MLQKINEQIIKINILNEHEKRNKEINILLDWIKEKCEKDIYNVLFNNRSILPSFKIRFNSYNLDEIDFIFLFSSPELKKDIFLIIEVEEQSFMSMNEINECLEKKEKKLKSFVQTIKYKNKYNKNYEIKKLVIVKANNSFFQSLDYHFIFKDLDFKDLILKPEIIKEKIFNLFNKAVDLLQSIESIFKGEFNTPDFLRNTMNKLINSIDDPKINVIKINGSPGSGKTLTAMLLYKHLIDKNMKVGFYTLAQNTAKKILERSDIDQKFTRDIHIGDFGKKSFNWDIFSNYDFIIVDEQQRLFKSQSNIFFKNMKDIGKLILIGDKNQKIKPAEKGFEIPKRLSVKKVEIDSCFLRYTKSHLLFINDLFLKGKIENKKYHSNLKFEFMLKGSNSKNEIVDKNICTINFLPYHESIVYPEATPDVGSQQINLGPLLFQGNECDIVSMDLSELELEKISEKEIIFKERMNESLSKKGVLFTDNIDDKRTKQMIYCAITRATQKIIIIGTEEMRKYFEYSFNILENDNE